MGRMARAHNISEEASDFIKHSLVWDNHGCMPLRAGDVEYLPQLERYRNSGVDVASLNVGFDTVPWENTLLVLAHFRKWVRSHSDEYLLIETVSDIEAARDTGRLGICFDIEGGSALNDTLSMVELYYELGVRWMLMAYNKTNSLGGGCQDDDPGLTSFGREVLDEMGRVGMVACCSHTGFKTTMDVMEYSSNPVIFSHSNPLGIWEHPRNIRDEAIRACAESGGVVGINGIGIFLGDNDAATATMVRHVDYVVQLVGPEHAGLGLDYVFDQEEVTQFVQDNPKTFPPELGYADGVKMVEPEQIPEIADALLKLGYPEDDIRLILGENHLRVAKEVWQ